MLNVELGTTPHSLRIPKVKSEEDRRRAGELLLQVVDALSNHPQAKIVSDLVRDRQSITVPLGDGEASEPPIDIKTPNEA